MLLTSECYLIHMNVMITKNFKIPFVRQLAGLPTFTAHRLYSMFEMSLEHLKVRTTLFIIFNL